MKLKFFLALFVSLCFSITEINVQNSSSVFDLVETDDQKTTQNAGNPPPAPQKPTLSQQNPSMILGPPATPNPNPAPINNNSPNNNQINDINSNNNQINDINSNNNQANDMNNNNSNENFGNNNGNSFQAMLDKIKSKITNPYLKDNLTVENISNFFANFISGNSFVNNLEVKDIALFNKAEVKDSLKVKGEASFEKISFNKIKNQAITIIDNEIIFDPEATIRLRNNKMAFKVKDVFEVITFMKYIVKICGSKLEKCDFNNLLKNHNANQVMQIVRTFQKKIDETQKKALEFQERKMREEKQKREEEEKRKKEEEIKKLENEKIMQEQANKNLKNNNNSTYSNNNNERKNLNNNKKNIKSIGNKNNENNNEKKRLDKNNNLRGGAPNINSNEEQNNYKNSDKEDDLITKKFTFKEKDLMDIEKELNQDFMLKQNNESLEDYNKFLENPQIADMMNNYYYSMPNYGLGMNNIISGPQF